MIEEQLVEVNKKIKQIEGILHRRKEKISQWNINYKNIIENKPDPSVYLQRTLGNRIPFKQLSLDEYQQVKKQLTKKASVSRQKVKKYYNELKHLDHLEKQKTKIRSLLLNQNIYQTPQNINLDSKYRLLVENQKNNGNQSNNPVFRRNLKDRSNPFEDAKVENFIDLSQQTKKNAEILGPKLMKYFGVGLEGTPFAATVKKEEKKDDFANTETKFSNKKKLFTNSFTKTFSQTFQLKSKILGTNQEPRNIFESRMRKIIKWHGDFWGEKFISD